MTTILSSQVIFSPYTPVKIWQEYRSKQKLDRGKMNDDRSAVSATANLLVTDKRQEVTKR